MERDVALLTQIPAGTKDLLPMEAKRKRILEAKWSTLFEQWGFREIVTPTLEYFQVLTAGVGTGLAEDMYKFLDRGNSILALRPDMTTPIARVAASRMKDQPLPLRLYYIANVFQHVAQTQAGRQCEFYQAGVELLGAGNPMADAEIIALAVAALQEAGLSRIQISIGQVDFINGVMEETGLAVPERQAIKHALLTRDFVGLGELLSKSRLSPEKQAFITRIPLLHGKQAVIHEALTMTESYKARQALQNLHTVFSMLDMYDVSQYVNIDLGLIRDFDYYTGMVFEVYTPGLGFPICGGGRYDNLVEQFGTAIPATGFAIGVERALLALERQGCAPQVEAERYAIVYAKGNEAQAVQKARELREAGHIVEVEMAGRSPEEVRTYEGKPGITHIIGIIDK
jgi:ATP phosphoribosyltransferase regulatory subunit